MTEERDPKVQPPVPDDDEEDERDLMPPGSIQTGPRKSRTMMGLDHAPDGGMFQDAAGILRNSDGEEIDEDGDPIEPPPSRRRGKRQ